MGWGFDAHRLDRNPPVVLGGVVVDRERGVRAHSDGDVAAHALSDAVLGAAALGDIGEHFPSAEARWEGADSLELLGRCVAMAASAGLVPVFADVTVISEVVRVAPARQAIRAGLAGALGVDVGAVSVKATTTDGLGLVTGDGIAAAAAVTMRSVGSA